MADNFNASVVCLIRYPNGTQHTKYVLTSGGGIKYAKTEDGILTNQLWHRYWNRKQGCFFTSELKLPFKKNIIMFFREKTRDVCRKWRMA